MKHPTTAIKAKQSTKCKNYRLGRRFFGQLEGDTFKRVVKLSKHLYRAKNAWSMDSWLLRELEATGCEQIEFYESEECQIYRISLQDFKRYGEKFDVGWGSQIACDRELWQVEQKPRQLELIRDG